MAQRPQRLRLVNGVYRLENLENLESLDELENLYFFVARLRAFR